jgi:hypothetical protein
VGLGSGKTQRYFASDFDRLSNRLFDAPDRNGRSRSRQRAATRHCMRSASTAMQYWIGEESTTAKYMTKPELVQPVEKKGKCFRSIAPIICRPRKRLDGFATQNSMKTAC